MGKERAVSYRYVTTGLRNVTKNLGSLCDQSLPRPHRRKHARLVGYALAALEDDQVPWHRVVGSRGRLTIGSGIQEQRARLLAEGVRVSEDGKLDLGEARWNAAHDGPAL